MRETERERAMGCCEKTTKKSAMEKQKSKTQKTLYMNNKKDKQQVQGEKLWCFVCVYERDGDRIFY